MFIALEESPHLTGQLRRIFLCCHGRSDARNRERITSGRTAFGRLKNIMSNLSVCKTKSFHQRVLLAVVYWQSESWILTIKYIQGIQNSAYTYGENSVWHKGWAERNLIMDERKLMDIM